MIVKHENMTDRWKLFFSPDFHVYTSLETGPPPTPMSFLSWMMSFSLSRSQTTGFMPNRHTTFFKAKMKCVRNGTATGTLSMSMLMSICIVPVFIHSTCSKRGTKNTSDYIECQLETYGSQNWDLGMSFPQKCFVKLLITKENVSGWSLFSAHNYTREICLQYFVLRPLTRSL